MGITFLTATIPPRAQMLAELLDSVAAQTIQPAGHFISVDWPRLDCQHQLNILAELATSEWLCPCADDDLLLPTFSAAMLAVADDADVVYGYADLTSWPEDSPQRQSINRPFDAEGLRVANWIPGGCTLIRAEMFRHVSGYPTTGDNVYHLGDWFLWHKLLDADARFVCLPEVTWVYRHHSNQKECAGVLTW